MANGAYLITGALGCIGSWVMYHLQERGEEIVCFDVGDDRRRLDLLIPRNKQGAIQFVQGDLRDGAQLEAVIKKHNVQRIIHLAALQVPFCKADPVMGAQVNVTGTVNVFEAARKAGISHLAYASSVAVYGPPELYPSTVLTDADLPAPQTLYGVYKVANEGTARVYWQDHQISSAALRPYTIYGLGRDQGLTSDPTKAMLAAVKGESFEIGFSGGMQFQWASDIARYLIAAADTPMQGAGVFNLGTPVHTVNEVIDLIKSNVPGAEISCKELILPFPAGMEGGQLEAYLPEIKETPLEEGVRKTIEGFRQNGL